MKGFAGSVIGVVLLGAAVAGADVSVASCPQSVEPAWLLPYRQTDITRQRPSEPLRPVRHATGDPSPGAAMDMAFGIAAVDPPMVFPASPEAGAKTIVLPADLSSLTMFLTAIGSLGAWQFVRAARGGRFHFGHCHIPEWYHTGGPTQVGHVIALDLRNQTPIFYCLDRPGGSPSLAHSLRRVVYVRRKSQFAPFSATSRGPPLRTRQQSP